MKHFMRYELSNTKRKWSTYQDFYTVFWLYVNGILFALKEFVLFNDC